MTVYQFDPASFNDFLGDPIAESDHAWGQESRYFVAQDKLLAYRSLLALVVYRHHSSFDYDDELRDLGFSQVAQTLKARRSGLPTLPETQMGNFAEVIGSEFGKWILNFETTCVIPKRFNPNVDQSMKGVDILGVRTSNLSPPLLVGEAKCYQRFDARLVEDSHNHLVALWGEEYHRILAFAKELLKLEGNKLVEALLDRVNSASPKSTLIFVITQNSPREPFTCLEALCSTAPLPNLLAVHLQIENLKNHLPRIFGED